ncbi:trichothecene C-15 hydroxylase [Penicillium lividum]|nr:trichothecene C-15 hydroxylase [Penicillium lividum]
MSSFIPCANILAPGSGQHHFSLPSERGTCEDSQASRLFFSEKAIQDQEPAVMNFINLFIKRLHERAQQGPQDLSKWFNLITFDVIGDLAFGEPFGNVDSGDYHPWVRTMTQNNLWSILVGSAQRLRLIQPLLRHLIPATLKEERVQMIAYTKDKVARRIS